MSSREDHGYLVDVGVAGARAFLPLQKAQDYARQKNKGEGSRGPVCGREGGCVGLRCSNATSVGKLHRVTRKALLRSVVNPGQ